MICPRISKKIAARLKPNPTAAIRLYRGVVVSAVGEAIEVVADESFRAAAGVEDSRDSSVDSVGAVTTR